MSRTVLIIGAGGREHALARRLKDSPTVRRVVVSPGNAGIVGDLEAMTGEPLELARQLGADLVVVGPEAPLCDGLVDRLTAAGFVAYGPTSAAAQLEASKSFMKSFAVRHRIRTARHVAVRALSDLDAALSTFTEPPVIKASGLCAGKGVVVAESFEQARESAVRMLSGDAFGAAGTEIVIEERLRGQEVSIHAVTDGERFVTLPAIQDHKRIFEGDSGPNTGGMGTYGPAPVVDARLMGEIERAIVEPIVTGMARDGIPYRGTIFAGLMISDDGEPVLLEINVRFGDPETQVLMGLLEGDLAELLLGSAQGELPLDAIRVVPAAGMCVVLAAEGYPESPRTGDVIRGLADAAGLPGVSVFHAGTQQVDGEIATAGGRVLGVTATASSLSEARQEAYRAVELIEFRGAQYRRDIGHRALQVAEPDGK